MGQNFSAQLLKGGGKNIVRGCRGVHILSARNPPPPVNNDRSLNASNEHEMNVQESYYLETCGSYLLMYQNNQFFIVYSF